MATATRKSIIEKIPEYLLGNVLKYLNLEPEDSVKLFGTDKYTNYFEFYGNIIDEYGYKNEIKVDITKYKYLKHLVLVDSLVNIPDCSIFKYLEYLKINDCDIQILPNSLKYFECHEMLKVQNIPKGLNELYWFGRMDNYKNIPIGIKRLTIKHTYIDDNADFTIFKNLEYLDLYYCGAKIPILPNSLKFLKCFQMFHIENIPNELHELYWWGTMDNHKDLPTGLKRLTIRRCYNLGLNPDFSKLKNLEYLALIDCGGKIPILPEGLTELYWAGHMERFRNIPIGLKRLTIKRCDLSYNPDFSKFKNLEYLCLFDCELNNIRHIPPNLVELHINCSRLL